jgi:hypothetical protein
VSVAHRGQAKLCKQCARVQLTDLREHGIARALFFNNSNVVSKEKKPLCKPNILHSLHVGVRWSLRCGRVRCSRAYRLRTRTGTLAVPFFFWGPWGRSPTIAVGFFGVVGRVRWGAFGCRVAVGSRSTHILACFVGTLVVFVWALAVGGLGVRLAVRLRVARCGLSRLRGRCNVAGWPTVVAPRFAEASALGKGTRVRLVVAWRWGALWQRREPAMVALCGKRPGAFLRVGIAGRVLPSALLQERFTTAPLDTIIAHAARRVAVIHVNHPSLAACAIMVSRGGLRSASNMG